jgi:Cu(I)/Ag(I) efflux system membrane fusion protein
MDMSMPGMEMPGMKAPQSPSAGAASAAGLADHAAITLAPTVQQRIGVMVGRVERSPLEMTIRTVGIVRPNETKVAHIHLKTEGWVRQLFVSFTGQRVAAGDPLLSIYSPTFLTTQQEYLSALRAAKLSPAADSRLADAARGRLELFDVAREEIETLEETGKAATTLTLRSPITGTVLEKKAFAGQYVTPQDELYMVADLSSVWVQAKVYEYELPHIQIGMPVTLTLSAYPGQEFTGNVVFIDPTVEEPARTVQVRIELPNEKGQFKPGMFVHATMNHAMGEGLTVPVSAVIRTGERDLVYRVEGEGRFVPVEVKIGAVRFEDHFQVLEGLTAGETVVTSANFLIDSESRLKGGGGNMAGMAGMEGMDMGAPSAGQGVAPPKSNPQPNPHDNMPGMDMKGDSGNHAGHGAQQK